MAYIRSIRLFLCVAVCASAVVGVRSHERSQDNYTIKATLSVNVDAPLYTTDDRFLSLGMDSNLIRDHWETFDFNSVRLQTLAKGLTPAYLRLMGTDGDRMIFVKDGSESLGAAGWPFPQTRFNMTSSDWDSINKWTAAVGWRLLFGINGQTRKRLPHGNASYWDPTNALQLLDYSVEKGYASNLDFEFGNEPDLWPANRDMVPVPPKNLGQDFLNFKQLLYHFYHPHFEKSLLVGPDVAGSGDDGWIEDFLNVCGTVLNATTFHHYYGGGELANISNYIDAKLLDSYKARVLDFIHNVRSSKFADIKMWNGETSSTYSPPGNGIDESYVAGFMLLDKLGLSARLGLSLVIRQTFYGFWFALVDEKLEPAPNYWLALMFKRLIGREVLDAQVNVINQTNDPASLRVYAHCTSERSGYDRGSVVIYAMNLFNSSVEIHFNNSLSPEYVHQFLWTAPNGNLTSQNILLNGRPVKMTSDSELPNFKPVVLKPGDSLTMSSYSMAYFVLPNVKVKECFKKANVSGL